MTSPTPPLPTFLIIGAQKSATRWLRSNLGEHPEVFAAPMEISFFNQRFRRGADFYRSQFEGWDGQTIVGEATPGYMMWRHKPHRVASRIKRTIPDVRLIVLLRSPIDRASSAMVHHVAKERLAKGSNLVDLATSKNPEDDRLGLVTGGWYAASLQPYVDLFGDQLLVFLHDDVAENPLGVYRRSLEHIGASPGFVPEQLDKVVYSNQKRAPRRRKKGSLSARDRERLWPFFKDDVARLETMIERDLSSWDPTPAARPLPSVPDDVIELHRRASAWLLTLIDGVTDDDLDRPTPCPGWTVRDLLEHLVQMARLLTLLAGRMGYEDLPEAASPARVDEDPARAYRAILDAMTAELSDGFRLKETAVFGERIPIGVMLLQHLVCQVGHGWDLAVATGQDPTIPAEILDGTAHVANDVLSLTGRAPNFADERPVARGASATDRFVAYLGRNPAVLVNT